MCLDLMVYKIKNANDIVLNSNTVSQQADFGAKGVKNIAFNSRTRMNRINLQATHKEARAI